MENNFSIDIQTKKEAFKSLLHADFYSFYRKFFIEVTGEEFDDSEIIRYLCDVAQEIANGNKKRIIINIPPRLGKSLIFSVALPAYILGRNPKEKIITVSYAQELATLYCSECLKWMDSCLYKELFPNCLIAPSKKTEYYFKTTDGGLRYSTTVGGSLTGFGGNFIIIDDPIKAQDALSEVKRNNNIEWVTSTLFSRLNNKKKGCIALIMQRLHLEDLSGFLQKFENWEVISIPAIAEKDEKHFFSDGRVFARKAGDVLLPNREPLETIEELRNTMSEYNFSAQYQQNPMPEKGNLIDFDAFTRYETLPESGNFIQSWDIAFKTGNNNDYSVCITAKMHENKIYITDIYREKLNYNGLFAEIVFKNAQARGCNVIIESTTGTLYLIEQIKARRTNVIPYQPIESKIQRANYVSLDIASGRVLLPLQAKWLDDFKREVIAFPHGKHDDQVDALTQLILRSSYQTSGEKIIEAITKLNEYNKSEEHKARKLMFWKIRKSWGLF